MSNFMNRNISFYKNKYPGKKNEAIKRVTSKVAAEAVVPETKNTTKKIST